jgi:hypothetical protein
MRERYFMFFVLGLMVMGVPWKALPGESSVARPNTHSTMNILEKFNQPENFFPTRSTFDRAAFKKNSDNSDKYQYVREDGVYVRQLAFGREGYQEEFTRPDSHYTYVSAYNNAGRLVGMGVKFDNYDVGDVLYFDEKGKIVRKRDMDIEGPFLPIEKLRKRFLDEKRVDIYDKKTTPHVYHSRHEGYGGKTHYDIFVRNAPASISLTAYLLDGATGEILFQALASDTDGGMQSAYKKYKEHLQSKAGNP